MAENNKEILENLCQTELTEAEVLETRENLLGFFATLYRIDKRLLEEKKDD